MIHTGIGAIPSSTQSPSTTATPSSTHIPTMPQNPPRPWTNPGAIRMARPLSQFPAHL